MSLAIREMRIKTPSRFHLTPVKMAITKETHDNKCWQVCGERAHLTVEMSTGQPPVEVSVEV